MNDSGNNVARHLRIAASIHPDWIAIKSPVGVNRHGQLQYEVRTFSELDQESDAAAIYLAQSGIAQGDRVLLAVTPGRELILGIFSLLKLGAVPIAIDPGMGPSALLACLQRSQPVAIVGTRWVTWLSRLPLAAFRTVRHRIRVGDSAWGRALLHRAVSSRPLAPVDRDSLAAILFTSGSTGTPKGVRYTHGIFDAQIELIRTTYNIEPGEIDMAILPLFGLFNPALGTTTITPWLDASRPLSANPSHITASLIAENVTSSFGSPAIWSKIADHCQIHGLILPALRRLLIAGAPVSGELLAKLSSVAPNCIAHTPYGATECLPVTTITSSELLGDVRTLALQGYGTCVGRPVMGVEIRVIREVDGPIGTLSESIPCAQGEVGEIIATGLSVTYEYDNLPEATLAAKIRDGDRVWHRMGDLGRIDHSGRLFFLGRRVEKVRTAEGDLPTESLEPIFRQHPHVFRCALIGLGPAPLQTPAMVIEPSTGHFPKSTSARQQFISELRTMAQPHAESSRIGHIFFQRSLPVDVRHNAKIHRLRLAKEWTHRQKSCPHL